MNYKCNLNKKLNWYTERERKRERERETIK